MHPVRYRWPYLGRVPLPNCQLITPLVYDESLSYLVMLGRMNAKICEIVEALKGTATYEQLEAVIACIEKDQIEQSKCLKDYTDSEIDALCKHIEWLLEQFKNGEFEIFDPTQGHDEYVGEVVNRVYEWLKYFAMTAQVFQAQGYTAQELDGFELTAREFDTGNLEFEKRRRRFMAYSNVTGEYTDPQKVFLSFQQQLSGDWNARSFADQDLTAEEWDAKEWTAFYYDWWNFAGEPDADIPIASATVLGGIKVGSGLEIDPGTGVLNAIGGGGSGTVYTGENGVQISGSVVSLVQTPLEEFRQYIGY